MGRNRFPVAEIERLHLSDGDWVEVKKDLNNGDTKKLEACGMMPPVRLADGDLVRPIDWEVYEIGRACIFLEDWSLRGPDDKVVSLKLQNGQVSVEALKALDPETFEEINKAIQTHVVARAREKNAQGTTKPTTSSSSADPTSTS